MILVLGSLCADCWKSTSSNSECKKVPGRAPRGKLKIERSTDSSAAPSRSCALSRSKPPTSSKGNSCKGSWRA
ncbi:Uncharacterised protein [Vibrio cholerae]|nr:Uncharacterised protein [Vibrio cholerae]